MGDKAMKRWYQYRKRSIKMGMDYCSIEEFRKFWDTPKVCSYCEIPENIIPDVYPNVKVKVMTVDRKDGKFGYSIENICWSCFPCNMIKTFMLTFEEMKEIGQNYIKRKWEGKGR